MLYSKNNSYPTLIPERIRLSSGLTRTGKDYTDEELLDAGYRKVSDMPECQSNEMVEWDFANGEWLVRNKTIEELIAEADIKWEAIRKKRDILLKESDWTQLRDSFTGHLAPAYSRLWALYRQALRDITKASSPSTVVWPIAPTAEMAQEEYSSLNNSNIQLLKDRGLI